MKTFVVPLLILLLAACAQNPYQPASGSGYGYSHSLLAPGQYQVTFRSRGDDRALALDYAMLRAAELALEEGYDWFEVRARETYVNRESVPDGSHLEVSQGYETYRSCSLLGCRTYVRPTRIYESGISLGDERSEVEVVLEINLGKGMRPEDLETHDAREVFARLNPRTTAS